MEAVDRDPIENGGKITYTFVSSPGERLRFTVEPDTGIIRTQHVSDLGLVCEIGKALYLYFHFLFFFLHF